MIIVCDDCKRFISTNGCDIKEGKFVLRKTLGFSYKPVFCCESCLSRQGDMYYILENAIPVLKQVRR